MSSPSAPAGYDRGTGSSGGTSTSLGIDQGLAEGRLERLNAAAAGLLEPLFLNTAPENLSAELAGAVQKCAAVANSVGLRGPDYLAALLVPFLQGPAGREFIANDRAAFESWVQEVIAFFAGSMEQGQVAGLVSQLDRWLGFAGVPPQFVALIAERLRNDLRQIREWVRQIDPGRYAPRPSLAPIARTDAPGAGQQIVDDDDRWRDDAGAEVDAHADRLVQRDASVGDDALVGEVSAIAQDDAVVTDATDDGAVIADEVIDEPVIGEDTVGEGTSRDEAIGDDAIAEDAVAEDAVAEDAVAEDAVAEDVITADDPADAVVAGPASTDDAIAADARADDVDDDATAIALEDVGRADGEVSARLPVDAAHGDQPLRPPFSLWPPVSDRAAWGEASQVAIDELAMLADAARSLGEELIPTLLSLETPSGQPAWAEFIDEYLARVEHMTNASDFIGAPPITRIFAGLAAQLRFWMTTPAGLGEESRRLLMLVPDTLAELFADLSAPNIEQTIGLLADEEWPSPLPAPAQARLSSGLSAIEIIRSRQVTAEPSLTIDDNDLSLEIPVDADRSVVDNLLRELPLLSAEFSEAIDLLDHGDPQQIERAQRVAHTLKGSANTVGVRGIATLTHRLEDILQLLGRDAPPGDAVMRLLSDAADCLAEMCDAVAGVGPAPTNTEAILREVVDATVRLLDGEKLDDRAAAVAPAADSARAAAREAAPPARARDEAREAVDEERPSGLDDPEPTTSAEPVLTAQVSVEEDARVEASVDQRAGAARAESLPVAAADFTSIGDAPPADSTADEMLRVPASVVSRLLEFANEAMIALAQMQERITVLGETRAALRAGSERFQDLSMELERLVDVRGLALTGRSRQADFDALELDEYNDLHTVSRRFAEAGADHKLVDQQFDQELIAMREQIAQLDRVQTDLREAALRTRMVAIDTLAGRLQRAVRQAARQTGKQVEFALFGGETEIDGQLLQRLTDPLMHMLRNAVDHGIEDPEQRVALGKPRAGRIDLTFIRDGAELIIRCRDDGRGLDLHAIIGRAREAGLIEAGAAPTPAEAARLILLPGFSTRTEATQLSGRGIGLDVVRERIRELRGRIDVGGERGRGLELTLTMPVRLAAVPVMILRGPNHVLAVSVRDIEQIASIGNLAQSDDGTLSLTVDGAEYPAVTFESLLGLPAQALATEAKENVALIVRGEAGRPVAVITPEPGQTRNVILQPLAGAIPEIAGIGGVAVMGDGAVAPIIDLPELLARRDSAPQYATALSAPAPALPVCLIVDDSVSVRRTMELFLQDLGLHVESAFDGIDALALIDKRVPDLVIADLEMPRMNGVELASALRARPDTANVPLIMITSRYSDKHKQLALSAGADIFLTKPYTEDELAAHVQRSLSLGRR